jgi:hypothetical protein
MERRRERLPQSDLYKARCVYNSLRYSTPPAMLCEITEAVLGLKCSRIHVNRKELDDLDVLARTVGFGIEIAGYKIIPARQRSRGGWSDRVNSFKPLNSSGGLFTAYLGKDLDSIRGARRAEESRMDDALGRMLGIPRCCRKHYSLHIAPLLTHRGDLLWGILERCRQSPRCFARANFLPQYFERGFITHFPCSFECQRTRALSSVRLSALELISRSFAAKIKAPHSWSYIVLRDNGIATFRTSRIRPRQYLITGPVQIVGKVPIDFSLVTRIEVALDRTIDMMRGGCLVKRYSPTQCMFLKFEDDW